MVRGLFTINFLTLAMFRAERSSKVRCKREGEEDVAEWICNLL